MRRRTRLCLVVAGIAAMATTGSAQAAITVANQNDSGPGSLRQAVAEAPPGETINVPAGTYTLTSEPLVISTGLTIAGSGAGSTIIRAGEPFPVLATLGPNNITISGVTIRDGNVIDESGFGAGIFNFEANLTLRAVAVTNNTVNADGKGPLGTGGEAQGGGIISVAGSLHLADSTVSNNLVTARGNGGKQGGEAGGAGLLLIGPFTIENSTVSGNTADVRGGQGPANPEQDGGEAFGAGLVALQTSASQSSIRGSTISGNVTDFSPGPGGEGGEGGGAGAYVVAGSGTLAVSNTTIALNVARSLAEKGKLSAGGGVIATANSGASIAFSSTTISGNRLEAPSSLGGGNVIAVSEPGAISFANTIISAGVGPAGSENCAGAGPKSLGFNLESLDQCGFKAAGDRVNTDPQLGPLQSNGGPTATMAPALTSPAIDQGGAFGLTADQRGVLRPIDLPSIPNAAGGDGSDIGAVEFQPSNAFTLGKLTKNKKKGTATLVVKLPQPSAGVLTLAGKGLKKQSKKVTGQTQVKLKIIGKGKVRKALKKKGKRKVKAKVTYAPTGNSAATKSRKTKLVKKKKPKKK
jgi:hypothetical protein